MADPISLSTVQGAAGKFLPAIPFVRKILKERAAARNGIDINIIDSLLDSAISQLLKRSEGDALWKKVLALPSVWLVSPDHFRNKAVQEWLSQSDVTKCIKEIVYDRIFETSDVRLNKFLIDSYSSATGENEAISSGVVDVAINVLVNRLRLSTKDDSALALQLEGLGRVFNHLASIELKIDDIKDGLSKIEFESSLSRAALQEVVEESRCTREAITSYSSRVDASEPEKKSIKNSIYNEEIDRIIVQINTTPSVISRS